MPMNATFLSPHRRKQLVRTHQSLGHVPVGGVGHNKGPLQILLRPLSGHAERLPGVPQLWAGPWTWPCPTRTARANVGAGPSGEGLGPAVALAVRLRAGLQGTSLAQPAIRALCWGPKPDGPLLTLPRGLAGGRPAMRRSLSCLGPTMTPVTVSLVTSLKAGPLSQHCPFVPMFFFTGRYSSFSPQDLHLTGVRDGTALFSAASRARLSAGHSTPSVNMK